MNEKFKEALAAGEHAFYGVEGDLLKDMLSRLTRSKTEVLKYQVKLNEAFGFGYVTKDEASAAAQVLAATGDAPLPTRMVLCTLCTAAASQALRDLADELDDVARIAKTKGKRLED